MSDNIPPEIVRIVEVIDGYRCAINKGFDDGIKVGQRLLVYGVGKKIVDPDTGEELGSLEIVRGRGKVTHVQARLATIETYEKEQRKRRITKGTPYRSIFGESVEEFDSSEDIPFNDVQVGDYAKFI